MYSWPSWSRKSSTNAVALNLLEYFVKLICFVLVISTCMSQHVVSSAKDFCAARYTTLDTSAGSMHGGHVSPEITLQSKGLSFTVKDVTLEAFCVLATFMFAGCFGQSQGQSTSGL